MYDMPPVIHPSHYRGKSMSFSASSPAPEDIAARNSDRTDSPKYRECSVFTTRWIVMWILLGLIPALAMLAEYEAHPIVISNPRWVHSTFKESE